MSIMLMKYKKLLIINCKKIFGVVISKNLWIYQIIKVTIKIKKVSIILFRRCHKKIHCKFLSLLKIKNPTSKKAYNTKILENQISRNKLIS